MGNFSKKVVINRVPFSSLLKLEIPALAMGVIEIVEKHNPEELLINEVFEQLVVQTPIIDSLTKGYGVHPLSLKLIPLRDKLMVYVSAIRFELKVATKEMTDETKDSVDVIKVWVDLYLTDLRKSKNETILIRTLDEFLSQLISNAELAAAIESLSFTKHVNNLKMALSEVKETLGRRLGQKSTRPKQTTSDLSQIVYERVDNLFKQIEVGEAKNTKLDYSLLISELNGLISKYRSQINKRLAHNKRKADEKKGIVSEGTNEQQDRSIGSGEVFVASAKGNFAPDVEKMGTNGVSKDVYQTLEQKKAAASPTKDLQLPSADNDQVQ